MSYLLKRELLRISSCRKVFHGWVYVTILGRVSERGGSLSGYMGSETQYISAMIYFDRGSFTEVDESKGRRRSYSAVRSPFSFSWPLPASIVFSFSSSTVSS